LQETPAPMLAPHTNTTPTGN